jgi:stage III sporulation protein AE
MKKLMMVLLLAWFLVIPAQALELTAPTVPDSGADLMPPDRNTFGEDLWYIIKKGISATEPELSEAVAKCTGVIAVVMLLSVLKTFPGITERVTDLCGAVAIGTLLLGASRSLVLLATETVIEMSEYGKMLLPVMTSALAAQGGVTASAAIYAGTVVFDAVLTQLIVKLIVPLIYVYLALTAANCALGLDLLKKLRELCKWFATWSLKIVLYVFTGYISVTGVISGTADAAAVKAAKLTISGFVPVVGGILSDASEAVLVGAGVVKNSVGIYGLLALISIVASPFIKIGFQYLLLKLTGAVSSAFGASRAVEMVNDFAGAMGLLLAMTGTVSMMLLISVVCMMKGVA